MRCVLSRILSLCAVVMLAACAAQRENQPIDPSIFAKSSRVLITETEGLSFIKYHVQESDGSNHGLLGMVIASVADAIACSANEDAARALTSMDITRAADDAFYGDIRARFAEKGSIVETLTTPILYQDLHPLGEQQNPMNFAPYDFRFLKEKHNVDYAFVMKPNKAQVTRYPGVFGMSMRDFDFEFFMIDLSDNRVVGYYRSLLSEKITGDWDQPPYTLLRNSAKETLVKTITQAKNYLLGD